MKRIRNYISGRRDVFVAMLLLVLLTVVVDLFNFYAASEKLMPSPLNIVMSFLFVLGWCVFGVLYGFKREKRFILFSAVYFSLSYLFAYCYNLLSYPLSYK